MSATPVPQPTPDPAPQPEQAPTANPLPNDAVLTASATTPELVSLRDPAPTPVQADLVGAFTTIQQAVVDIQTRLTDIQAKVQNPPAPAVNISAQDVATEVVKQLLTGTNLAGLPDDMGLPADQQLGKALQNYFVWSAHNGTSWALQSAENWLLVAVMLDAMNGAADPAAKIAAAQQAAADLRRTLGH